jgi:pimeloyl-ACP methyl ester carboxylesterase
MDAGCHIMKEHAPPPLWPGAGFCAQAGWFGPANRARFGWFYRPDRINGASGVVIVPPFGRDDICVHRTLRHLAETCARSGFVTLRFDPDGCGDSAGDDSDADRVESWIASVRDACDTVRRAGMAHVTLIGIRLGASLATLAAQYRDDVVALVAFNAVVRGSHWLHELRAFQIAMNLQPPPLPETEEGEEACGFLLGPATCAAVKAIDLTRVAAPAPRVLLLERDDLPASGGWYGHLQARGCRVEQRRIPGYADMMVDAHLSHVAQVFIDACIDFLRDGADPGGSEPQAAALPLRPSATLRVGGARVEETVMSPGAGIFGILARPLQRDADRALLVLNAGAVRHIGAGRFDVALSRQMAAAGLQALRVDLTGIGDSPARAGVAENLVYPPDALNDTGLCVDWLRARGARELIVGGMCSGASHALRAALAGLPIDAAYLVNCGLFAGKGGLDPAGDRRFKDIAHYGKAVKSARSWRKLLSGNVDVQRVARAAIWKVALEGRGFLRDAARRSGFPMRGDLSCELEALARRGVKMHFLYSGDDPGRIRLAVEAGSSVAQYCRTGQFSMHVFPGANHTFTQRWAQASLLRTLRRILTAGPAAPAPLPARLARPVGCIDADG